jgi:broad specificity phosphatase PhoE
MGMPRDLVLVRHGQSEANVIQKQIKEVEGFEVPEGFLGRHDSEMLLTAKGVGQAAITGEWLKENFPDGFDHYHVSSLARTIQTAGRLALGGPWIIDDRLREQDWGEFSNLGVDDQARLYRISKRLRDQNEWYWCAPGGESLATGVRLRWERLLNTMHREMDGDTFIGVTHGGTIEVGRVILERLLIPEWLAQQQDEQHKVSNTQVLHYTRRDPETGKDAGKLRWLRSICPWDEERSWNGGEWMELNIDRRFSDDELLQMVADKQPLLPYLAALEA